MWYLDNFIFQKIINNINIETTQDARKFLMKVPFYKMLNVEQQDILAQAAYIMKYPKDTKFLQEN